jgi:hypothetical protein
MKAAGQKIAVMITFRNSNKNSLERRAGAYRPRRKTNTLFFYVVRTAHFGTELYNDQRNAQVFN